MKTFLANLWAALCGRPVIVPVMIERGERWKLMTHAEVAAMKKRWATALRGHSLDPEVQAILEMIEYRITQASGVVQTRRNHAGESRGLVSYGSGEAAGLNDLLLEVVRALHAKEEVQSQNG